MNISQTTTLRGHAWTVFQGTEEIWVKSWVSTFIKKFALWKSATEADGMLTDGMKQNAVAAEHRKKVLKRPCIHE